jgi:hypothetical protein
VTPLVAVGCEAHHLRRPRCELDAGTVAAWRRNTRGRAARGARVRPPESNNDPSSVGSVSPRDCNGIRISLELRSEIGDTPFDPGRSRVTVVVTTAATDREHRDDDQDKREPKTHVTRVLAPR